MEDSTMTAAELLGVLLRALGAYQLANAFQNVGTALSLARLESVSGFYEPDKFHIATSIMCAEAILALTARVITGLVLFFGAKKIVGIAYPDQKVGATEPG